MHVHEFIIMKERKFVSLLCYEDFLCIKLSARTRKGGRQDEDYISYSRCFQAHISNMEKLFPDHKSLILFQNTIIFSCFNLSYVVSAPRRRGESLTLFFSLAMHILQ